MKPVVLGMAQPYPGYSCEQVTIVASRILDTIVASGQTRHNISLGLSDRPYSELANESINDIPCVLVTAGPACPSVSQAITLVALELNVMSAAVHTCILLRESVNFAQNGPVITRK
jgi:hypothetical protein